MTHLTTLPILPDICLPTPTGGVATQGELTLKFSLQNLVCNGWRANIAGVLSDPELSQFSILEVLTLTGTQNIAACSSYAWSGKWPAHLTRPSPEGEENKENRLRKRISPDPFTGLQRSLGFRALSQRRDCDVTGECWGPPGSPTPSSSAIHSAGVEPDPVGGSNSGDQRFVCRFAASGFTQRAQAFGLCVACVRLTAPRLGQIQRRMWSLSR